MASYIDFWSISPWRYPSAWYARGNERVASTWDFLEPVETVWLGSTPLASGRGVEPAQSVQALLGAGAVESAWKRQHVVPTMLLFSSPHAVLGSRATSEVQSYLGDRVLEETTFSFAPAPWTTQVVRRVSELLCLPDGWDSYGGRAISYRQINRMMRFLSNHVSDALPPPAIVPLSDGGIQIEWHRAGLDVEIAFTEGEDDGLYCVDLLTGDEWEGPADEVFDALGLGSRLAEGVAAVGT